MNIRCLSDGRYLCGESPVWSSVTQTLCWTDIDGKSLHRIDAVSDHVFDVEMPGRVGCIAPTRSGGFLAAMEHDILQLDENFKILRHICRAKNAHKNWRFNDGRCDRSGAYFWVGSIYLPRDKRAAGVWRLSKDGQLELCIEGITTANGIAWSPDGTIMYVADSWRSTIWSYDYNEKNGEISNQRIFYQTTPDQGRPDGAAVDECGYYWFAGFGGGRLIRLTPDGIVDQEINVPVSCPTMVAFGGVDMKKLFFTSYRGDSTEQNSKDDALSGGVFSLDTKYKGIEEVPF